MKKMLLVLISIFLFSCQRLNFKRKNKIEIGEIFSLIEENKLEEIRALSPQDTDKKDKKGLYPIHKAVLLKKVGAFKCLFDKVGNVDFEGEKRTLDIIEYVAQYGTLEMFKSFYISYGQLSMSKKLNFNFKNYIILARRAHEGKNKEVLEYIYNKLQFDEAHKNLIEQKYGKIFKNIRENKISLIGALIVAELLGYRKRLISKINQNPYLYGQSSSYNRYSYGEECYQEEVEDPSWFHYETLQWVTGDDGYWEGGQFNFYPGSNADPYSHFY